MKTLQILKVCLVGTILAGTTSSYGALLTFDDAIAGATTYSFDGDGDGILDVIFSTIDPAGFNTAGPGTNMSYISQPGLEGTTGLSPDLKVDFLNGAITNLGFGFAINFRGLAAGALDFRVYDISNTQIASVLVDAALTPTPAGTSTYSENQVNLNFAGIASYATFNFSNANASRFIIDNFLGVFGSTDDIPSVPEPGTLSLLLLGVVGTYKFRQKKA